MDRGAGYPSPTRMEQGEGLAQELPQVPGTPSQRSGQSQQSARLGAQENGPIPQQTIPGRNMSQQGMTPGMVPQGFTQQQQGFSTGQTVPPTQQQQQQTPPQMGGPAWFSSQWFPRAPGLGMSPGPSVGLSSVGPSGQNPSGVSPNVNPQMFGGNLSGLDPSGGNNLSSVNPSPMIGPTLGGVSPQMASIQDVLGVLGSWNDHQLQILQQHLNDRFVTMQQRRLIPERFGDRGESGVQTDFVLPTSGVGELPVPRESGSVPSQVPLDVFAKSEKWLAPAPVPSSVVWKSREDEIIQWSSYLDELVGWAAQASLEFSTEIAHSARWPKEITWASLTQPQQARSRRLLAIIRAAFATHPRCANLVNVFCEGVPLTSTSGGVDLVRSVQQGNGYELVRQMTLEFSIRSRSEALSMRANIATKSFCLSAQETTPSSVVSDTIRKLDLEVARFSKLLATMPVSMDMGGLRIGESDLVLILLRSLPETVKNFCLHHSQGDSYEAYRVAARRWEDQQRLFGDFGQSMAGGKKVNELEGSAPETYNMDGGDWQVDAMSGDRCAKCGSRKHQAGQCTTDLSKTKCFRCGSFGHVSMNCKNKPNDKGKGGKGVIKSDAWDKGKGKKGSPGKGKGGKKGKMNEVSTNGDNWDWSDWTGGDNPEDAWWYSDQGWNEQGQVDMAQGSWDSGWYGNDWSSSTWYDTSNQQTQGWQQTENSGSQVVGSLILSPVLQDLVEEDVFDRQTFPTGLFMCCSDSDSDVVDESSEHSEPERHAHHMDVELVEHMPVSQTCGLIGKLEDVDSSALLCSSDHGRVFRVDVANQSWVDAKQEVSEDKQLEPFLSFLDPLLSQVADQHDASWWLLDSGASTTVLAENSVSAFSAAISPEVVEGFSAANGSQVQMKGRAEVGVHMFMSTSSGNERTWKKAKLRVLVGNIKHNILSVTSLADSGWKFTQGPKGFDLYHTRMGLHCLETAYFANCPWVRLYPDVSGKMFAMSSEPKPACEAMNGLVGVAPMLCPLSKDVLEELEQHRRQGHVPFHAQCLECARGRSVFQHRRKRESSKQVELQADFGFLSQTGEISMQESERAVKILVISEMMSGSLGAIVMGDEARVHRQLKEWLDHFGIASKDTTVVVRTDAEIAVGEVFSRAIAGYKFMIRRASPQQHRSIGAAERGVREIKESLAVLRADLNLQGLDIAFSETGLTDCLTYLCLCHNHFGRVHGTDTSPLEVSAGKKLGKPPVSMFGSCVLAEIPDSIREMSPNETRNVEGCFVHPGLVRGAVVQAKIRCDGGFEVVRFTARNIRPISPLSWSLELGQDVIQKFDHEGSSGYVHDRGLKPETDVKEEEEFKPEQDFHELPVEEQRRLKSETLTEKPRTLVTPKPVVTKKPGALKVQRQEPVQTGRDVAVADVEPKTEVVPPGIGNQGSGSASPEVKQVRVFEPTRRCPACESQMNVPGIRHSKECKKRFAEFQEHQPKERRLHEPSHNSSSPELAQGQHATPPGAEQEHEHVDDAVIPEVVSDPTPPAAETTEPLTTADSTRSSEDYRRRFKRTADVDTETLEKQIRETAVDSLEDGISFDWFWTGTSEPVLMSSLMQLEGVPSFSPATSPDMYMGEFNPIRFNNGVEHDFGWSRDSVVETG